MQIHPHPPDGPLTLDGTRTAVHLQFRDALQVCCMLGEAVALLLTMAAGVQA